MNFAVSSKWIFIGFAVIAGFFLITEHKAHVYGAAPYILFGAFMLLHFFMHTGHGGHEEQKKGGHHGK